MATVLQLVYRKIYRHSELLRTGERSSWRFQRKLTNQAGPPSFGIAFDIDGVLLRGGKPIGGAPGALRRLYDDPSNPAQLRVPYIFLTNGGGSTEAARAVELSKQLDVPVISEQVILGHTPFKALVDRFGTKRVLAVGKGEPDVVMKSYGFQQVVHMDSYVREFDDIDGLGRFKPWYQPVTKKETPYRNSQIAAVFVVSDPIDWSRDIQVICDVLRSDGNPGIEKGPAQTPIYFAADDLEYQSTFRLPRLGMGAFRLALEIIYNRLPLAPMQYVSYGKPQQTVYKHAQHVLQQLFEEVSLSSTQTAVEQVRRLSPPPPPPSPLESKERVLTDPHSKLSSLKTIYMIGDNPFTDIQGAKSAGIPWFAIMTRTGCYREGQPGTSLYLADKVVEDVEEAIQFIAEREGLN